MRFKEFYLTEAIAIDDVNKNIGKKKVVVFQGRLNPPTKAHTQVIPKQMKKTDLPVVLFLVRGKKSDLRKNPLKVEEQLKMIKKSAGNNIDDIIVIPDGFIGTVIDEARNRDLEPVKLFTGSDRFKNYKSQMKRYQDKWNTDLEVSEIKRNDEDISATKLREAVKNDDFDSFLKLTHNLDKKDFEIIKKRLK